jgi:hypothetical protein
MEAPTIKRTGNGTINAIRKVWINATSTQFAMVLPDDGCARLAIRIGSNLTTDGREWFHVGDKVKYTVLAGSAGEFPRAQDLNKFAARSNSG